MSDRRHQAETAGERFIRHAGEVQDPDHKLWAPARFLASMVQYLVAMILLTIGKGLQAIFTGEKPEHRREREGRKKAA